MKVLDRFNLRTSEDIRLYQCSILERLENKKLDTKKAKELSGIAYKIQMSLNSEIRERELNKLEELQDELGRGLLYE